MIKVVQMQGTETRLYQYVAPLVMNAKVLKQNYNFPFRTSEYFVWFIALNEEEVIGFIPIEEQRKEYVINNYYIKEKDLKVLDALLLAVLNAWKKEKDLTAICFLEDMKTFSNKGFTEEKMWTRYVKMRKG